MKKPFRLTLIHPCMGRRPGEKYLRTWQMESLPIGVIASLTPKDVDVRFYDDRMEVIPFDEPTDLVGISIETFTAKRAYQIASEYRKRGIPVVMGGFHASLLPDEVSCYAESVIVGEAEELWPQVLDDYRHGTPKKRYQSEGRPALVRATPDRSLFKGKRYLPVGLIEAGRGCVFHCDFCAIQTVFKATQRRRPNEDVLRELEGLKDKKLIFFVDDNITANLSEAKEFFKALIPLKIRWISQASINTARDEELLALMKASGCQGVLIGFESLNPANLESMEKGVNLTTGGFEQALKNLHKHGIRIYGTFVFGYDGDTPESFPETVEFARRHGFYLSAFAHLTPFPGTKLYSKLESEGRLLYDKWWLDDAYRFAQVAFKPKNFEPEQLQALCVEARHQFYSWPSIIRRAMHPVNRSDFFMFRNFFPINALHGAEVNVRNGLPLGDPTWKGELITAN